MEVGIRRRVASCDIAGGKAHAQAQPVDAQSQAGARLDIVQTVGLAVRTFLHIVPMVVIVPWLLGIILYLLVEIPVGPLGMVGVSQPDRKHPQRLEGQEDVEAMPFIGERIAGPWLRCPLSEKGIRALE